MPKLIDHANLTKTEAENAQNFGSLCSFIRQKSTTICNNRSRQTYKNTCEQHASICTL